MHNPNLTTVETDVVIIGAGASGLFCAMTAGKRGRKVLVLDHANKAGKKILMSGGGRCNFTNYDIENRHYLSQNPHFCKSALSRYLNWDFIALVNQHGIAYQEKDNGQLFCKNSANDILQMLLNECEQKSRQNQPKNPNQPNHRTSRQPRLSHHYRQNDGNLSIIGDCHRRAVYSHDGGDRFWLPSRRAVWTYDCPHVRRACAIYLYWQTWRSL